MSDPYQDDGFPERACDRCGQLYRGPAVYCSLKCAIADSGTPIDMPHPKTTPLEQWPNGWLTFEVASLLDVPGYIVMHEDEKRIAGYPVTAVARRAGRGMRRNSSRQRRRRQSRRRPIRQ
jgi:hypothetical protein